MSVVNWLKCENCLWWVFANEITYFHVISLEKQDISGCIHPDVTPQLNSCSYRCNLWVCRRCFTSIENIIMNTPEIENHNHCKKVGRGRKSNKNTGFIDNGEQHE
jgi:hypothetical protein